MKVYTVHYQIKYEYDFSVEQTNHGCFKNKEDAIAALQKIVAKAKEKECVDEMEVTENFDNYDSGDLYVEEENDFFYMSFGYREHHEAHTVWIDEWEVM